MAEIHTNAEQEIAELERVLEDKRAALGKQKEAGQIEKIPHEKEILREALREKIAKTAVPVPILQPGTTPTSSTKTGPSSYLSDALRPKVDELVKVAFAKSLEEAISLAKATGNAALIDAFHDILVDELYSHLLEKGKIGAVI